MTALRLFFSGHPVRIAAGAIVGVLGLSAAWYLGSPLFIRTYTEEALPAVATAAPAPSAAATISTGLGGTLAPAAAKTLAMGELGFVDNLHNGKGAVKVIDLGSQQVLRFESVAITNAPDVHVYLSRDTGGKWTEQSSLYLGALKATNGSFNYDIPAGMDTATYKSVVVWCRAFSVLITWADLR